MLGLWIYVADGNESNVNIATCLFEFKGSHHFISEYKAIIFKLIRKEVITLQEFQFAGVSTASHW